MANYNTTPGGVRYEELNGYPMFSGTSEQLTGTTKWKIAGADLWRLFAEGFPEPVMGGSMSLALPMQMPGMTWLFLQQIDVEPLGGEDQTPTFNANAYNTYSHLVATLRFGTVEWEWEGEDGDTTIRTTDVSIGGEFQRMDGYRFYWKKADDDKLIKDGDVDLGKLIPTLEYSLALHNYPYLPLQTIIELLGKVNKEDGDVFGHEEAETLLYLGASANRTVTWKGTGLWQLTHRFSERSAKLDTAGGETGYGWNYFWNKKSGVAAWQRVVDENDKPIYPLATLSDLFTATE